MTDQPQPTCSTCPHSVEQRDPSNMLRKVYACHRFPPQIVIAQQGMLLLRPGMNENDWCNEHPERKAAIEAQLQQYEASP